MDDYDNIIKENLSDKIILSQKLLQLKKRNWYYELKMISEYVSYYKKIYFWIGLFIFFFGLLIDIFCLNMIMFREKKS